VLAAVGIEMDAAGQLDQHYRPKGIGRWRVVIERVGIVGQPSV